MKITQKQFFLDYGKPLKKALWTPARSLNQTDPPGGSPGTGQSVPQKKVPPQASLNILEEIVNACLAPP